MQPSDLIEKHFRLTAAQKSALKRLQLITLADLLRHFPVRYESIADTTRTDALAPGSKVTLYGTLTKLEAKRLWKSKRPATEGIFEDAAGRVKVLWFNQPYIANMVPQHQPVKISGAVAGSADRPYITNPEVEPLAGSAIPEGLFSDEQAEGNLPALFPVYGETRGITSKWFYHAAKRLFQSDVHTQLEDSIPTKVRERYSLPALATALVWIHTPEKKSDAEAARKRFAFEEVFVLQVAKQLERSENDAYNAITIDAAREKLQAFLKTLSFTPTGAQTRAIEEIVADFQKATPMARLLEGDVGSGKTVVAAATAYLAVTSTPPERTSGTLQVAYMAPTEILAGQHFQSFCELFRDLPVNIGLITGSGCYKFPSKVDRSKPTKISRTQLLKWVANGEIAVLVGTHALIQKNVAFKYLAYVIVDEQHRFGTRQRRSLAKKGDVLPHFLSMTATPIPRTLALTIYGDLDISILDELPPGRGTVITELVSEKKRADMYERIRQELAAGRQAYVICPRIDEPDPAKQDALRAKSATAEAARLEREEFAGYTIGLLHGKLTPAQKETVMRDFAEKKIDVLVATSVVEVGINVPNATVILIEGAERFGLAQLHQLRGRVQRSSYQPYCYLLPEKLGERAKERLKALEQSSDGFALAEADLKQRGAGDLYGFKQWGISDIGMEALQNPRLIEAARSEAAAYITDPDLAENAALQAQLVHIREQLHEE